MAELKKQCRRGAVGPILALLRARASAPKERQDPNPDRLTFGPEPPLASELYDPGLPLTAEFYDYLIDTAVHYKGVLQLAHPSLRLKQAWPFTTRFSKLLALKQAFESELKSGADSMAARYSRLAPKFPQKRFWGNTEREVLEQRRKGMAEWLNYVLSSNRQSKTVMLFLAQVTSNSKGRIVPELVLLC